MRLTLIRHGETDSNRAKQFQDFKVVLNESGMLQAENLSNSVEQADVIISSPLPRASQTASKIAEIQKIEVIPLPLLQEVRLPAILEGTGSENSEYENYKRKFILDKFDESMSDGETFLEIKDRAEEFLRFVISMNLKHIIAVSHGMFIKTLISSSILSAKLTPEMFFFFQNGLSIKNASISSLSHKTEWKVMELNNTNHLK